MKRALYFAVIIALLLQVRDAAALAPARAQIPAKAAVVMDATGAILYAKYPQAKLAPASTVKLVTAMVVLDRLDPASRVRISPAAARTRTIPPRLRAEEEFTVADLLRLALMRSVNSAAVALAEAAAGTEPDFVVLMNRKARELGAHSTLFANASGLPKGAQYTTAGDLALIMQASLTYPLIKEILGTRACTVASGEGREIFLGNSNELLWEKENVIGGKTGYTGDARHCFVCAINTDKGPLYTAVLGARSRRSLWKSTLLLEEIVLRPQPAAAERPSRPSRSRPPRPAALPDFAVDASASKEFPRFGTFTKFGSGY